MNQRIRELIRQSVVPADQAEDYALAKGLIEPTEKLDVAKFAELVIRECATLIPAEQSHAPDGRPLVRIFEEHFGVEE